MMNKIDIAALINNLKAASSKLTNEYNSNVSSSTCYTIDSVLDIFYQLVERGGYLVDSPIVNNEIPEDQRFFLRGEYPDESVEGRTIVTFDIKKREPASLSSGKEPFHGTKQYRPYYIGERRDGVNNEIVADLALMYDNQIEFIVWSSKVGHARNIATLFEQLIHKYYWTMRQYAPVFIYRGRSDNRFTTELADAKYYGIPLNVFIRTVERFELRESEITGFDIQVHAN